MRWDELFDDLEAQMAAQEARARESDVAERTRAEVAAIVLADRLRAAYGSRVALRVSGHEHLVGTLSRSGPGWLVLADDSQVSSAGGVVVHTGAVLAVRGLGRQVAAAPPVVESRLGLTHVLRVVARDRAPTRLGLRDGAELQGTIDRVFADHLDLAEHPAGEVRRTGDVRAVVTVPLAALAVVRIG